MTKRKKKTCDTLATLTNLFTWSKVNFRNKILWGLCLLLPKATNKELSKHRVKAFQSCTQRNNTSQRLAKQQPIPRNHITVKTSKCLEHSKAKQQKKPHNSLLAIVLHWCSFRSKFFKKQMVQFWMQIPKVCMFRTYYTDAPNTAITSNIWGDTRITSLNWLPGSPLPSSCQCSLWSICDSKDLKKFGSHNLFLTLSLLLQRACGHIAHRVQVLRASI